MDWFSMYADYLNTELKSLRRKLNWEIEEERHELIINLYWLIRAWRGRLPDLRDIFRPEEIDFILDADVRKLHESITLERSFIFFAARSGYKDEPKVDEDGKPLLRRSTPIHRVARSTMFNKSGVIRALFEIFDRYDINYIHASGLSHFHVACKFGCDKVVEKFLELGLDPNHLEYAYPPLYMALFGRSYVPNSRVIDLLLRGGADVNVSNAAGSTSLHIICDREQDGELAKQFFKIVDDKNLNLQVDVRDRSGNTPLHLALRSGNAIAAKLLLRRGASPNLANVEHGWTPLHIICQRCQEFMEKFFEINYERNQLVQVDSRDREGRTPLQLAVVNFTFNTVDVLLKHGADLSNFVFPSERHFNERFEQVTRENTPRLKLTLASRAMITIERLETRGYELDLSHALIIMKFFDKYNLYEQSEELDEYWYDAEDFTSEANNIMIIDNLPGLSLYVRVPPKKAAKQLTYLDYFNFARSNNFSNLLAEHKEEVVVHLCEMMGKKFFRQWALEAFVILTHCRLPSPCCQMIIDQLMNKDLYNICLAATGQSS
ncbi:unnamed protein product [Trichogramma brassicae]|uniref:Uncharacterized protein n=1 Tax=Trichogramma brassicae TaxID=86971 RepID=A0A6H5IZQ8_9HYME|nr:unnamed protein product [Trichogramma brassicae]